jgi:hypothetical protein
MQEDPQAHADRIAAAYDEKAPWPPAGVVVPETFWYLHFKAFTFLMVGPEAYRGHDALQQPPEHLPQARIHAIKRGCEQIVQFRGLSADEPLEGIGVDGFYAMLRTFHFTLGHRAASSDARGIIDRMTMRHIIDGREVTLHNLVVIKWHADDKSEGATCAYCQRPLRTPFAKQCRHCRMDWHNPANPINRKTNSIR